MAYNESLLDVDLSHDVGQSERTVNDRLASRTHRHFVTGKLAAHALRITVDEIANKLDFDYSIGVMPITVAALMTPRWLIRHLTIPEAASEVILPGYIGDDIDEIQRLTAALVRVGPRDLRDLEEFLCGKKSLPRDLIEHDIEIIAEINHAPRFTIDQLLFQANALRASGADRIDVGCDPGSTWTIVGDAVAALVEQGHRVSIDSFNPLEVAAACRNGATLVLSVNSFNAAQAKDWGAEVVAIPDSPTDLDSLDQTLKILERDRVRYRIDPILEPIGMGFANSIARYHSTRRRYPDAELMMGIGNLTELSDVDSAGINFLLLGICAELKIRSVLTTQVISWAQSSVRECDLARRIVHYAVVNQMPPKRVSNDLIVLRDPKVTAYPQELLTQLAATIRDNNYRLFAQDQSLHVISAGLHLQDADPFRLFESLMEQPQSTNVDTSHAFYLGFELAKAQLALQLGKQYRQDQSLHWGHLTVDEPTHRLQRNHHARQKKSDSEPG